MPSVRKDILVAKAGHPKDFFNGKFNPNHDELGRFTFGDGGGDAQPDISPIDDPPIEPVYPVEQTILALFAGSGLVRGVTGLVSVIEEGIATATGAAEAVTDRTLRLLIPDGTGIGEAGQTSQIREVSGGIEAADQLFNKLTEDGVVNVNSTYPGLQYIMPDGSYIGYRVISSDGTPTIDIGRSQLLKNIIDKLKFPNGGK